MSLPIRQTFSTGTPLGTGVNLLEASAGTGKTWSIVSIIAHQIVIEGRDLDEYGGQLHPGRHCRTSRAHS